MPTSSPPLRVLVFVLCLVAIIAAAFLVIFETGDAQTRATVLAAMKWAGGVSVAGVPATFAWLRGEGTRQLLTKVDTQTNGGLDARIRSGVLTALADFHVQPAIPAQPAAPAAEQLPPTPAPTTPGGLTP